VPELRKDPIVGRWVIISTERARRPSDFATEPVRATASSVSSEARYALCADSVQAARAEPSSGGSARIPATNAVESATIGRSGS